MTSHARDLEHARQSLTSEVQDECQTALRTRVRTQTAAREKNLLREPDRPVPCLCNAAKDDNINVDGDVIKRLDAIPRQRQTP